MRRLRADAAHPEDGALRQVEGRRKGVDAEHAQIGERESPAAQRLGDGPTLPGGFDQRGGLPRDLRSRLALWSRVPSGEEVRKHGGMDTATSPPTVRAAARW